jgi:hypothetical protein
VRPMSVATNSAVGSVFAPWMRFSSMLLMNEPERRAAKAFRRGRGSAVRQRGGRGAEPRRRRARCARLLGRAKLSRWMKGEARERSE